MSDQPQIKPFQPRGLEEPKDANRMTIKSFTPNKLNAGEIKDYSQKKQTFGSFAATDEKANSKFSLHPDSKKYLGVEEEERSHLETMIRQEVEDRVAKMKDQAYAEGFKKGVEEGNAEAQQKLLGQIQPLGENFAALLDSFEKMKEEMYCANERILIQLIFNVARQVLLKDLKEDPEYLKRLCTQMIEKIGIRDHLKIKISKTDLEGIDQLKEYLKAQYTDLKNVKIETSDEVQLGGCKIETNLMWINASVESQLKAIEESFKEQ